VHHALADGVAAGNLLARAIEWSNAGRLDDNSPPPEPKPADPIPTKTQLLRAAAGDHLRQLSMLPVLLKNTAGGVSRVRRRSREREYEPALAENFDSPKTFINHVLSPRRTFASAALALADVKQTSKHLGITINDLVLAMSAGALRELLLRHDGAAEYPLIASVPASLDSSPERVTGNELGGMFVSLPVHISDPLERVRLTRIATAVAKENFQLLGPALPSRWAAYLPPPLAQFAFRRMSLSDTQNKLYNLPISNVPGPRARGSIAGAALSELYSVGPLTAGSGINITVWSYVDLIAISVIADDWTLHDPHEATDAMLRAFAAIRSAAGLSVSLTEVPAVLRPAHSSVAT
jgi:diacylglycerol O-acyltransferase